jgi:hypothetical protein
MLRIKIVITLLYAFTMAILISGCINTEGTLKLQGKVLDERTKKGIPFRKVMVQGLLTGKDQFAAYEAGQFSTDSAGAFSFTLRKIRGAYNYRFSMVGDSLYPYTTTSISLGLLKRDSKYTFLYAARLADLTIIIKRKTRIPASDTLSLTWESNGIYGWVIYPYKITNYGKKDNAAELTANKQLIWIGGNIYSEIKTRAFAGKRTILHWDLYRNGKRREFTDTITCKREILNILHFTY